MKSVITAHPMQLAFAAACADVHNLEYGDRGAVEVGPGRPRRLGVAYLVRPEWAATAASVLKGLRPGQRVALRFSGGVYRAVITALDVEADCALLRLPRPLRDQIPMPLQAGLSQPGVPWQTWAAAPTLRSAGCAVQGLVHEPLCQDARRGPTLLLHPLSGTRAWQPDLAGSPVLHGGRVLGHLRGLRESAGTEELLACPAPYVATLLPAGAGDAGPPQPPKAAYSPAWYVARPELEAQARRILDEPGAPLMLCAPEQHGKTWLWEHVQRQLLDGTDVSGRHLLRADLDDHARNPDAGAVLSTLALDFAAQLGSRIGADLTAAAQHAFASAAQPEAGFDAVLEHVLLPRTQRRLVVVVDRVDALHGTAFRDVLLARLRGMLDRADEPLWQKLRLVLLSSTAPAALVKHPGLTPFTLGSPIELPEFDETQVLTLIEKHSLAWGKDEAHALMGLIGGNPYLLRLALYSAVLRGYRIEQIITRERSGARVFDPYLERCKQRLIAQPGLWPTAQRVLREHPLSDIDRLMLPRLERMGMVSAQPDGTQRVRCPLYLRLLDL